jgi:hypothetical protein
MSCHRGSLPVEGSDHDSTCGTRATNVGRSFMRELTQVHL